MKNFRKRVNSWFLAALLILGVGLASGQIFLIHAADGIVCKDYFVNHKSIEPFYGQYKMDPNVLIRVREIVLAGGELTATSQGKILLFVHGNGLPGTVSFDLDHANCSMMRYFAREGWDTFALDFEGLGLSSRPPIMDYPLAFPEAKAPIHSDVTVNNVERIVDFISNLRGIKKVHLLGWSMGASRETPIYTIQNQDKVGKLVLYAPTYMNVGFSEGDRKKADLFDTKVRILPSRPLWSSGIYSEPRMKRSSRGLLRLVEMQCLHQIQNRANWGVWCGSRQVAMWICCAPRNSLRHQRLKYRRSSCGELWIPGRPKQTASC